MARSLVVAVALALTLAAPAAAQSRSGSLRPVPVSTETRYEQVPGGVPVDPPPPPPDAKRMSGGVLAGRAVDKPQPVFPAMARHAGIEGPVVVEIVVDETGRVTSARALSGHPLLRDAAVEAALKWAFLPTKVEGVPVKVIGTITFNFKRAAGAPAAAPVDVSRKSLLDNVVEGPVPAYPPALRDERVFGVAVVEVVVDPRGTVVEARGLEGERRLTDAASEAVKRWRFKSMVPAGENTNVRGSLAFDFTGHDTVEIVPSRAGAPPVDVETADLYDRLLIANWPLNPTEGTAKPIEGLVRVNVVVDEEGRVSRAMPISGPEPLVEAARRAIDEWVFEPAVVDGEEVSAIGDVYLLFEKGVSSGRLAWSNGRPLRSREEPTAGPPSPPPPSDTSPPRVVRLSTGVLPGKATRKVEPVYPEQAAAAGVEGRVVVEVTVNEEGRVIAAHAVSGHPLLRDAAVEAARQWVFAPTHLSGRPVKVIGAFPLDVRKR